MSGNSSHGTLNTTTKIGIAVGGSVGLIIFVSLTALYIRWFQRKRAAAGLRSISGPYVQELEGGKKYHGYRESELVDSGTSGGISKSSRDEDKRLEFIASAVELDGRERSRSRSRGRAGATRPERVPKQFF